ncbi:MAG: hypothetical protein PHN78_07550 [Dehalococcoidales bacterium]|nr:hypothetical protein [Dehalococcoidales bacterium]
MRKKFILLLSAVLLLTSWPVAYAHESDHASQGPIQIEAAEISAAPGWNAYGRAIGGVTTPGDLFYIDATNSPADISVTLYLTNTEELVHCYRYLILNLGVYSQNGVDQWQKATTGNGELIPDTYITMRNGEVSFILPGYAIYKITIDSGCYYSFGTAADGGSASPKFYLTAE